MTIDTSGKYWKGSEAGDLVEYLGCYTEGSYVAKEFRHARCKCGSDVFRLEADLEEGGAKRTCPACKESRFICDSEEIWEDAEPKKWKCTGKCKCKTVNICVGFALREGGEDVHWVYIGVRCSECGTLDCFGDWKIDYSPSMQLLEGV